MRKIVATLIFVVLSIAALGQSVDDLKAPSSITKAREICEIEFVSNGWGTCMDIYQDPSLIAILAQFFQEELGIELGMNTQGLIREGYERDELANNKWVAPSPRLQERTLEPATVRLVVTTGGSYVDQGRSSYSVGGYSVSTEAGTSTAFIAVTAYSLVNGRQLWAARGEAKYSSTNVESIDISRLFSRYNFRNDISYSQYRDNPPQVRGLISSTRALEDLRKKLHQVRPKS